VLDEYDMRASAPFNTAVCDHYPEIIEAGIEQGWEFLGHGTTDARSLADLDPEAERAEIERSITSGITTISG
jgi:peptidoglycan/xylan/chitin deacetylase (PgdA/CDA1 family)